MRVIAFAYRKVSFNQKLLSRFLSRNDYERNLEFLGLVWLSNNIKPASPFTIKELRENNIRTLMATGDNIQTAVSVARKCNIVGKNRTVVQGTMEDGKINWTSNQNNDFKD